MFKIDSIEWYDGFTSLPQIRRDFPEYKWIAIDNDRGTYIYKGKPKWNHDHWSFFGDILYIANCRIIEGQAKDTLRRL